ncbi:MAG: hypothetical protein ACLUTU_09730 [Blautia faecis]
MCVCRQKKIEVYHLMDLKEWFSILIGLGSFFEGIALYFFIFRIRVWDLAYLCVALILGILFLLRQTASISRRIMEAEYCYMELEPDSLAVCQPEKMEDMSPAVFLSGK